MRTLLICTPIIGFIYSLYLIGKEEIRFNTELYWLTAALHGFYLSVLITILVNIFK